MPVLSFTFDFSSSVPHRLVQLPVSPPHVHHTLLSIHATRIGRSYPFPSPPDILFPFAPPFASHSLSFSQIQSIRTISNQHLALFYRPSLDCHSHALRLWRQPSWLRSGLWGLQVDASKCTTRTTSVEPQSKLVGRRTPPRDEQASSLRHALSRYQSSLDWCLHA